MEMLIYLVFIHLGHLAQFFWSYMVRGTFMLFEIQNSVAFNFNCILKSEMIEGEFPLIATHLATLLFIKINSLYPHEHYALYNCIPCDNVIMYIFIFRQLKTRPLWKLIQTFLILFILKMINSCENDACP